MTLTKKAIETIQNNANLSIDERIQAILQLGLDGLVWEIGIISHIVGNRYTVMYTTNSDLQHGVYALGNTYCSITLRQNPVRALGVQHFKVSDYFRHPAYTTFNLEAYLGIPICMSGKIYGTLNYTQAEPRQKPFSKLEHDYMRWSAAAIGSLLEAKHTSKA